MIIVAPFAESPQAHGLGVKDYYIRIVTLLTTQSEFGQFLPILNFCQDCVYADMSISFQSHFFDRNDVSFHNIAEYFKHESHGEREHAEMMMKYHNKRGGTTSFSDILVRIVPCVRFPLVMWKVDIREVAVWCGTEKLS